MMKSFCIYFLVIICCSILQGQICDDFSDGDLTSNPAWAGNTDHFLVNNENQLQLNAPAAGESSVSLPVSFSGDVQWTFYFRLDFSPSTSNLLRIYLNAKDADLLTGDGYYLEIGSSGNTDPIRFFRQSAGIPFLIAESAPGIVANEPVDVTMKVTKVNDQWNFFADFNGGAPAFLFGVEESGIDISGSGDFGFYCKFSETRKDRFFFDDICIGPFEPDLDPPVWNALTVLDATHLSLTFNEFLALEAENESVYHLLPGDIQPSAAMLSGNEIELSFDQPFSDGVSYTLMITEVADTSGNTVADLEMSFNYFEVSPANQFDLLINEIMADPNPTVSLPNAEYLEVYHNGTMTLDLGEYKLVVGSKSVHLPNRLIFPDDYLILCDVVDTSFFTDFGIVIGVEDMPSLTNTGTSVALVNGLNADIHRVDYSIQWYGDPAKDDGGWSLELINPLNVCADIENWQASNDLKGGTPGAVNSVLNTEPDLDGPMLIDVVPSESNRLLLRFDESILDEILDLNLFQIQPSLSLGGGFVSGVNEIVLAYNQPFEASVIYTLTIISVKDCQGNEKNDQSASFGIPELIEEGDLLINEILFNPATGGARFIELLNASAKILNTNEIVIGEINRFGVDIESVTTQKLIFPGDIIVLTSDPQDILSRYQVPQPNQLIEANLPGWNNDIGNVSVLSNGIVIDSFSYDENWHNPTLDDVNGVSLERISTNAITTNQNTWHSAAETAGFATPTGPNSQFINLESPDKPFSFVSTTFSPDQDGFEDFLTITFQNTLLDGTASVNIYNSAGRLIRKLARNQTIGSNALIQWDGTNDDGEVQRIGTYIVTLEIFNPDGEVQSFKEVCVLAQKL